jgi:hypothetical protein
MINSKILKEAHRWYQNGDHPKDNYIKGECKEGEVVRRYRTPELNGKEICRHCGYMMHDHGWIDPDIVECNESIVCPGDWVITDSQNNHFSCNSNLFKLICRICN